MADIVMTNGEMDDLKGLIEEAKKAANRLYDYMWASGLEKIPGCFLKIEIDPKYEHVAKTIEFGKEGTCAGYVRFMGGKKSEKIKLSNNGNSPEYEVLFADEDTRKRIKNYLDFEKELPPDGLWLGVDDDPSVLDSGRDVDDTVANC